MNPESMVSSTRKSLSPRDFQRLLVVESTHHHGGSLFVSPDRLMLNNGLRAFRSDQEHHRAGSDAQSHHQTVWAAQQQHERLNLPLHSVSEWPIPTQHAFRNNLPPTPISPFRPLDPLSEDAKAAFPCTGTADDCWNLELCPKHRQWPKIEQPPTPPEMMQSRPMPHNPRRRSAPASDLEPPPAKMKRYPTEPEEADSEICGRFHSSSIGGETRATVPKGRVPHNLVERRYRDNLNNQIEALRLTLPSLRDAQPCLDAMEDPSGPRMPSKAIVISTAATYIRDMENERARLLAANTALQEQVSSLKKLVGCDNCSILQYLNAMQLNAHAMGAAGMLTPS